MCVSISLKKVSYRKLKKGVNEIRLCTGSVYVCARLYVCVLCVCVWVQVFVCRCARVRARACRYMCVKCVNCEFRKEIDYIYSIGLVLSCHSIQLILI